MIVESHAAGGVYGLPAAAFSVWLKLSAEAVLAFIPGAAFSALKIRSLKIFNRRQICLFLENI